jgi:hypothetical protein
MAIAVRSIRVPGLPLMETPSRDVFPEAAAQRRKVLVALCIVYGVGSP